MIVFDLALDHRLPSFRAAVRVQLRVGDTSSFILLVAFSGLLRSCRIGLHFALDPLSSVTEMREQECCSRLAIPVLCRSISALRRLASLLERIRCEGVELVFSQCSHCCPCLKLLS